MFGWVAAIGAGIGAVAFDLGTSACAAVAGTVYGEHKTQNQMKKKVNKFAKRLEKRLENLNASYRCKNLNKKSFEELSYDADEELLYDAENNNYINQGAKANNKNNNLAKTQIYGNKKYVI